MAQFVRTRLSWQLMGISTATHSASKPDMVTNGTEGGIRTHETINKLIQRAGLLGAHVMKVQLVKQ